MLTRNITSRTTAMIWKSFISPWRQSSVPPWVAPPAVASSCSPFWEHFLLHSKHMKATEAIIHNSGRKTPDKLLHSRRANRADPVQCSTSQHYFNHFPSVSEWPTSLQKSFLWALYQMDTRSWCNKLWWYWMTLSPVLSLRIVTIWQNTTYVWAINWIILLLLLLWL